LQLLTYQEAAAKLSCSDSTVKRMVAAGVLVKVPVGNRGARVAAEDIDAYIRSQLGYEQPERVPITAGKRDAFFAKCGEIARRTGRDKLDVVDETLGWFEDRSDGRTAASVNDLSSDEASVVLDFLDAQVRILRRQDGDE
jgi:excisionase family DNA binding protein